MERFPRLHVDDALHAHAVDHLESLGVRPAVAQHLVVRGRGEPRAEQPRDAVALHARRVHEEGLRGWSGWDRRRHARGRKPWEQPATRRGRPSWALRGSPEQARGPLERREAV